MPHQQPHLICLPHRQPPHRRGTKPAATANLQTGLDEAKEILNKGPR